MDFLTVVFVFISVVYLFVFLSEPDKFKVYNFFSLLGCIFLTSFLLVYTVIGRLPENTECKIIESTSSVSPGCSFGTFKNNSSLKIEIVEQQKITKSKRFGILKNTNNTTYIINVKDNAK